MIDVDLLLEEFVFCLEFVVLFEELVDLRVLALEGL
jgi:hypothetical protein